MKEVKSHNKLVLVKKHRKLQYLESLYKFMDGQATVEYVQKRWQKLKELPK